MKDLDFTKMLAMQETLQEKYKDIWSGNSPEEGRNKLLWMIAECGEVSQIIKKNGDEAVMNDGSVRAHFVEEMCDVMMYFNDILLCYGITPDEFAAEYVKKHEKNLNRW